MVYRAANGSMNTSACPLKQQRISMQPRKARAAPKKNSPEEAFAEAERGRALTVRSYWDNRYDPPVSVPANGRHLFACASLIGAWQVWKPGICCHDHLLETPVSASMIAS